MASQDLRVCLVASGGGHVRQLLDLEPLWKETDYVFVTEDTALTRSLALQHKTYFIPHVALGQAKLGAPFRMLFAALRSLFISARIIWQVKPDVLITTGAGSGFFVILWARLTGARIILVDSFARFDAPSVFARMAGPFAHLRIAQSEASAKNWPGSVVFDPFRVLDTPRPPKQPLLFATVGATLPFDRLVRMVVEAKKAGLIPERVIVQSGVGAAAIDNDGIELHETLPFDEVKAILRDADIVVCHGGTGSLITALREGCRVVAVPRSFRRREHYDDHQVEVTHALRDRGLLDVVGDDDDFAGALARVRAAEPRTATTDHSGLIAYLRGYLDDFQRGRGKSVPQRLDDRSVVDPR